MSTKAIVKIMEVDKVIIGIISYAIYNYSYMQNPLDLF